MRRSKTLGPVLCLGALFSASLPAADEPSYTDMIGERVAVFENKTFNYRLDLSSKAYTFVDFSGQIPEASFAAIRFRPNAFSLVVVEQVGSDLDPEGYAELVHIAMQERLASEEGTEYVGHKDLGTVTANGLTFFQKTIYARVGSVPMTYVVSATVDGERFYQLLTFAASEPEDAIKREADSIVNGFSIIDRASNLDVAATSRSVKDYRSDTFAYRFRARGNGWFNWSDLKETNDGADIGALSARGYGAVVMPVCWLGDRPNDSAIFRVMMQQFGEDYPSPFITRELEINKGDASGKLLVGVEEADGQDYLYHTWIVANDQCAYALAAWGPARQAATDAALNRLWADFSIESSPTAIEGNYESDDERAVNAYLLNTLGLHYYNARSFRDAHRFFAQASELVPDDEAFLLNAVRSLVEVSAYNEARDYLLPRRAPLVDNQEVQSWDAWLAYQTNDPVRAMEIYAPLFARGYREDDDFSAYLSMLADAGEWQRLDEAYDSYTAGGVTDKTRLLQVELLSRREKHEEALALLDEMSVDRPFDADLVYQKITILNAMGKAVEVLKLADSLIARGYKSLQSYYYKGDAEYQLRSYSAARASFEMAQSFAPGNSTVRDYIEAIDLMMGQGDVSMISTPVTAVKLPKDMQRLFDANDTNPDQSGYGAVFLSRITGYDFPGGDTRTETHFRKIRVINDNGVAQFSTLEFDFDPSFERLYVNSLRVISAGGEILGEGELGNYYITNSETGYEASTEKTVHLPVPSLKPGAVIEVIVSKLTAVDEDSFPLETVYMAADRPIAYSAIFVGGNHEQLAFQANAVPAPQVRGDALVWELESPVAFRWEPLQPYVDQILPWVTLGTVGSDWDSVGNEYLEKIHDKIDVESVADRATRLVEGVSSMSRQVQILSAYVQDEIRYEAIEFGRRAYIPKTARETIRDRYGDCKDHALLLYSMLQAVGIDASLALVNLQQSVVPTLPNTDQFNHMIVAVTDDNGRVFIDATDKDMRLGALPPRSMAGNHALLLGARSELARIPDYESSLTGIAIERIVEAGEAGLIKVTETAQLSGYQAAELRGQLRSIEASELQPSLQRWVASRYSDAELTDYVVENVFDADYDLIVEFQYTLPVETDGSFELPGFLEAYYLEYDRVADRRFPFEFFYPLRVSAKTSVNIPSGRKLDTLANKPTAGESRFGNWRREVSESDGRWSVRFDYVARDARFQPEDYREFAEFQRRAVDAIEQALIVQ
ncbi:MAG TPA: DUF3857 domain-containing protein [Woeseiaceae bacterium]|nr:DUF3857 domain-containing protein [Woeseiaceae bacterium]